MRLVLLFILLIRNESLQTAGYLLKVAELEGIQVYQNEKLEVELMLPASAPKMCLNQLKLHQLLGLRCSSPDSSNMLMCLGQP